MVFNETEKQECEYLQQIISLLNQSINNVDVSVKEHVDTLAEYKDYLWSNKDIDPHEIRSMRESILNHFALGENVINKRRRLSKILDVPYFGRIDFREQKENYPVLPIYIGVYAFYDEYSKKSLIYDWRAPISSMFYDYELGAASYSAPTEKVNGIISLKRQYRIRKGQMEFMLESSLTIHDDILQKELSSNADEKMKNIVATIQREQNKIIRNEDADILIIQGVAGSGKTSIALHRIAYMLYRFKNDLSAKDMLIISPNKVFADYISNVLPELGEETVPETGIEQILSGVLENKYKYQSFIEQVEELLTKSTSKFIARIHYKASFEFISKLDQFILYIENTYFKAIDVRLTKYVIPAEYIEKQFRRFSRYPMRQRFEAMANYIIETAQIQYKIELSTAERNRLKKEIKNMFAGNNDIQVYKDFFEWIKMPEMFKMRRNRLLEYSDLAPLAYIHIRLEGNGNIQNNIKHLLIDEMQDYSPIQYKVLQKLFLCRKTILGDVCQSVNPYGSSTSDMIQKVFVTGEVMKLCKSYRSTFEITNFAQMICANVELEPISRHGIAPQIIELSKEEEEISIILDLISAFKKSTNKSLGIICKTEKQAQIMADQLRCYTNECNFLSNQSRTFIQGTVVTFAHMAKGLEFDEVIIPQVGDDNYSSEIDRSMLYVAVTRAMHKLTLLYYGKPNRFIQVDVGYTMPPKRNLVL